MSSEQAMTPQEMVERALELSKADGCIVLATEGSQANLRWANNTLTTNGQMRSRTLAVISIVAGSAGTAAGVIERSAVAPQDLESLVRESEQAARDQGPAEDAAPLVQPSLALPGWEDGPQETEASVLGTFARELGHAFEQARSCDRLLYGFADHEVRTGYLGTSTGIRLRHVQPTGKVQLTAKPADLSGSAWAGVPTRDFSDVDVPGLVAELDQRLDWQRRPVSLPAGRYETILPPSAVADLMLDVYYAMSARDADEGRTVFSRTGGGSKLGEQLASLPLTLRSDPAYPGLQAEPFLATTSSYSLLSVFDNGLPVAPTSWIQDGRLNRMLCTRAWAARSGHEAAAPIDNLILEGPGGGGSVPDLVSRTDRGLLLTCLWYIRVVDPQTLLVTGLTRDGVYLVENGEVTGAVNNFRFNESPVELLGRVSEVGATQIALAREMNDYFSRTAMPPLRIPDFNMSTVSQAS